MHVSLILRGGKTTLFAVVSENNIFKLLLQI